MKVSIVDYHGLSIALETIRLSFNSKRKTNNIIWDNFQEAWVYKNDVDLAKNLILSGDSHAKALRMVQVWLDIQAPRYWWAEFDTYKIGVTEMSESTTHTILSRPLDSSDFEGGMVSEILEYLNDHIIRKDFMAIKATLPESFLQRRIVNINYQTLRHIYFDRRNHKLPEWQYFIENAISPLPFSKELIIIQKE